MRNADVRRACLALIHHRLGADLSALDPPPLALGWQLENGRASAKAMAALCAGALAGAAPARWQPSRMLRGLLGEYGAVCQERLRCEPAPRRGGGLGGHTAGALS